MYAEINAVLQSAKPLFDLIKATKELSTSTEIVTAVNDIQMRLSSAIASALASQENQAALAAQVRELEMQLRDVEDWKNQIRRYQLVTFPTGALAHQLKAEMANDEPIHYLCTACADKKKKTTLQPRSRHLSCPECKLQIRIEEEPPIKVTFDSGLS